MNIEQEQWNSFEVCSTLDLRVENYDIGGQFHASVLRYVMFCLLGNFVAEKQFLCSMKRKNIVLKEERMLCSKHSGSKCYSSQTRPQGTLQRKQLWIPQCFSDAALFVTSVPSPEWLKRDSGIFKVQHFMFMSYFCLAFREPVFHAERKHAYLGHTNRHEILAVHQRKIMVQQVIAQTDIQHNTLVAESLTHERPEENCFCAYCKVVSEIKLHLYRASVIYISVTNRILCNQGIYKPNLFYRPSCQTGIEIASTKKGFNQSISVLSRHEKESDCPIPRFVLKVMTAVDKHQNQMSNFIL